MPAIARWLIIGGLITIAVGIVIGAVVTPWGFLLAGVGLSDLLLAYLFASGRLKAYTSPPERPDVTDEVADAARTDPDYKPYARED